MKSVVKNLNANLKKADNFLTELLVDSRISFERENVTKTILNQTKKNGQSKIKILEIARMQYQLENPQKPKTGRVRDLDDEIPF